MSNETRSSSVNSSANHETEFGMSDQKETTKQMALETAVKTKDDQLKNETRMIVKNIVLVSFAFLLNFTAFQGLSRLQSSLHRQEGMGVITSSVIYASMILSCFFTPKLLIRTLGHKWTITLSFSGYILWMTANGYAIWGTMIPTSILIGFCAAPLWIAQCSYFTILARRYSELTGETAQAVLSRFFGIFFMFFQMSSIFGSIISSTILMPTSEDNQTTTDPDLELCGINDCPWNNVSNPNYEDPSSTTVWTMLGVYISVACSGAIIVAIFVDKLPPELRENRKNVKKDILTLLLATFRHLRHLTQLLIITLTVYSGLEQGFYNAEWNKSFITCSVGIWKIGLITLPYGIVNATGALLLGHLVKYTGRPPIFLLGFLTDFSIQMTLLFWQPSNKEEFVFYIISALWGISDGIWQTQINALYGCLFILEPEAAFSNYRVWESLGFIVAFAYSNFLCTNIKIYVLTSTLCVGMLGYVIIEILLHRRPPATAKTTHEVEDIKF